MTVASNVAARVVSAVQLVLVHCMHYEHGPSLLPTPPTSVCYTTPWVQREGQQHPGLWTTSQVEQRAVKQTQKGRQFQQ